MEKKAKIFEKANGTLVYEIRFIADRAPRGLYVEDYEKEDAHFSASDYEIPIKGKIYMVAEQTYTGPNGPKNAEILYAIDNGEGWAGNSDSHIKRYHGWRGTTDDWALYGAGVRRCLDVKVTGKRSQKIRIVFSKDIKKDID